MSLHLWLDSSLAVQHQGGHMRREARLLGDIADEAVQEPGRSIEGLPHNQ